MSNPYSGFARPTGRYASELEKRWAGWFKRFGWPAEYVGDRCVSYDFLVDSIRVEIKPTGEEFVRAAINRAKADTLIITDSPAFAVWWWFSHKAKVAHQLTEFGGDVHRTAHPKVGEHIRDFLNRVGVKLNDRTASTSST